MREGESRFERMVPGTGTLKGTEVPGPSGEGTVLFVDDDVWVRHALERAFRRVPFRALFAASGAEALDTLSRCTVQVLVADLNMPGMSGLELVDHVKRIDSRVVCMLLSSVITGQTLLSAINSGNVYRYFQKPWDETELLLAIENALDLYRLNEENKRLVEELEAHNRHLEEQVAQRIRQLSAVEPSAFLGRFAAQLVHNLKNPLHVILGAVDILDNRLGKDGKGDDLHRYTGMIQEAALDMADMVEAILEHLGGNRSCTHERVDVNAIVRKQIEFMEVNPLFRYKMSKEMHLCEDLPLVVVSPMELQEVLYNLIRNAGDAMEQTEEKTLRVSTSMKDDHIVIEIKDTGEGIAPEDLDKIFHPDFTTKPFGKGTGLGLARVKEIVEDRSWEITVQSEPGRGTTFTLSIPVNTVKDTVKPESEGGSRAKESRKGEQDGPGEK